MLLTEIAARGCIDRSHQPMALLLMALSPQDVARCTMAHPTANAIQMMRDIKDALGVSFKIANADTTTSSVADEEEEHSDESDDDNAVLKKLANAPQFAVSCVGINFAGFRKVG